MENWGKSLHVDLYNCNHFKVCDAESIKKYVIEVCEKIDMIRHGEMIIDRFGNEEHLVGYSVMQFIETSCITGHFAEDINAAFIDIFSCKDFDENDALEFTKEFFEAESVESISLNRG